MSRPTTIILLLCATFVTKSLQQEHIVPLLYQWKSLDFEYESETAREQDIEDGVFIVGNISTFKVEVSSDKIFLTIPRSKQYGVPATFGTVPMDAEVGSAPNITPYPNWEWNRDPQECKEDRLVSVHAARVDSCGRLWILDTGKIYYQVCRPQILIFDLKTDELIHRYTIPEDQVLPLSILGNIVVDDVTERHSLRRNCKASFAYIADSNVPGMIVYDLQKDQSWRIEDNSFAGTYNCIPNERYNESILGNYGLLGMALGQDAYLYFQALCSKQLHYVERNDLKGYRELSKKQKQNVFHTFQSERSAVSTSLDIDEKGRAFFDLVNDTIVSVWNVDEEYEDRNFHTIQPNIEGEEFSTWIRVSNGTIWVLTKDYRFDAFLYDDVFNFKLCKGDVDALVAQYGGGD